MAPRRRGLTNWIHIMKRIKHWPRSLRGIAAGMALCLGSPAAAQQPGAEPTVTRDQAVARALARSPAMAQASQQVENAEVVEGP